MKQVLDIILSNNLYGVGEYTEIAKGKYNIPYTYKQGIEKIKRVWYMYKNN